MKIYALLLLCFFVLNSEANSTEVPPADSVPSSVDETPTSDAGGEVAAPEGGDGDEVAAPEGDGGEVAAPEGGDGEVAAPEGDDGEVAAPEGGDGEVAAPEGDDGEVAEDGAEGGEEEEEEEGPEGHEFFLPFFLYLLFGLATQLALMRFKSGIPYTLILLFAGIVIGIAHESADISQRSTPIHYGLDYIVNISPELFLTVFLPVLVMSDAMNLNMHLFLKTFGQTVMLAGTGVFFGAFFGGLVAFYLFPYEWGWVKAALFGSILAATDPVAVVALLNQVGASPILTMQITGESLLNDGSAIVLFLLFYGMEVKGESIDGLGLVWFSIRMAVVGPVWGMFLGSIFTYVIGLASRKTSEADSVLQIVFTIVAAYCVYYTGEHFVNSSGVLATTFGGAVMASHIWPTIVSLEAMEHVWSAIEFVANTLLFMFAGTIFGAAMIDNADLLKSSDWGYLFLNFATMVVIRFAMIAVHYLPLTRMGYPPSIQDAIFMAWGGLRGAVGLALAVTFYQAMKTNPDEQKRRDGVLFVFLIGGSAACTLLFLGTTSKALLDALGLIKTPGSVKVLRSTMRRRITLKVQMDYVEMNKENPENNKAHIAKFVRALKASPEVVEKPETPDELKVIREVFLHIVRAEYWDLINKGELPEHSSAATILLASIESAMDDCTKKVDDFKYVKGAFENKGLLHSCVLPCFSRMCFATCPCNKRGHVKYTMEAAHSEVYAFQSYISAHVTAQALLEEFFGIDNDDHEVVLESEQQVVLAENALKALEELHPGLIHAAGTTRMAALLLYNQKEHIEELLSKGILSPNEADLFMEEVEEDEVKLQKMDEDMMVKLLPPKKTSAPRTEVELADNQPLKAPAAAE